MCEFESHYPLKSKSNFKIMYDKNQLPSKDFQGDDPKLASDIEMPWKRTPKVGTTMVKNAKPILKSYPLKTLLNAKESQIKLQGDNYVIKRHNEESFTELSFYLFRNFMLSDFVLKVKETLEAQETYFNLKEPKGHPKKEEALSYSKKCESELKAMVKKMNDYIQTEIPY